MANQIYYTKEKLYNGDILLTKGEICTDEYTCIKKANGNLLLKKLRYKLTNMNNIDDHEFAHSLVMFISLNDKELHNFKYTSIRDCVYKIIGDGMQIIKNSILNIKLPELNTKGFTYNSTIGISVQGADSNKTIREIIIQCQKNNIWLSIKIKLNNGELIWFII
jgi:hypothetical protein